MRELAPHCLSQRAIARLRSPSPAPYLDEHAARGARPYHSVHAPDGYIPLCIAENRLVWDLLSEKACATRKVDPEAFGYLPMVGDLEFRGQLADFMAERFLGRRFAAEQIAVVGGAGSVLELLFWALADPGDGILVPTPSYAGFWYDLEGRDELSIVPVHTESANGFRLTVELLDRALEQAGRPIRALLLTSPNNPLGRVYDPSEIDEVVRWAESRKIHLVVDEVYALSVFGDRRFTSVAQVRDELGEWIHVVWAFSKDFAASGLRCGVLVSENRGVFQSVQSLAYWAACSGDTQALLSSMITDMAWLDRYVDEMRSRLRSAYELTSAILEEHSIPYVPSHAGFFTIVDLRPYMQEVSWPAEEALWRRLLSAVNVNLTPGFSLRAGEPGFARLCFASVGADVLEVGVRRFASVLAG